MQKTWWFTVATRLVGCTVDSVITLLICSSVALSCYLDIVYRPTAIRRLTRVIDNGNRESTVIERCFTMKRCPWRVLRIKRSSGWGHDDLKVPYKRFLRSIEALDEKYFDLLSPRMFLNDNIYSADKVSLDEVSLDEMSLHEIVP